MILPNKYLTVEFTLIGAGSLIISKLKKPKTVSALWDEIREENRINTYQRFILCLDFLFLMGYIDIKSGLLYIKKEKQ